MPGTSRRADEPGIRPESGVADRRAFGRDGKSHPADVMANAIQERLPSGDHASAEHDHIRVNGVHHADRSHGQIVRRFLDDLLRQGIAAVGGFEHVAGRQVAMRLQRLGQPGHHAGLFQGFPGPLHDCRGAGIGFQMTGLTAAAQAAPGRFHDDMADFRSVTVLPFQNMVVNDDAAADAGPEREQDHAFGIASGPDPVFPEGRRIGVVLKGRRFAERVGDVLADRHVFPRAQIGRIEDDAGGNVHRPRRGDADGADGFQTQPRRGDGTADGFAHLA